MNIKNETIKKILVITLSNIGDIVLTTPVVEALHEVFPESKMDILAGASGEDIFGANPFIGDVILYNKHGLLSEKISLIRRLRAKRYSLVVDLRRTIYPYLIGPKYKTSLFDRSPKNIRHKIYEHLWRLTAAGIKAGSVSMKIHLSKEDRRFAESLLRGLRKERPVVAISPGAKSHLKRWKPERFADVADGLAREFRAQLVMVGDKADMGVVAEVMEGMKAGALNIAGKTTIRQLAAVLGMCDMMITNDSGALHIASAAGIPILAIFGPTDHRKYGPTGKDDKAIYADVSCRPCENAQCRLISSEKHKCMEMITAAEVSIAAKKLIRSSLGGKKWDGIVENARHE